MEISVTITVAIIILVILNTIATHLINWAYRHYDFEEQGFIPILISLLRWISVALYIKFITQGL